MRLLKRTLHYFGMTNPNAPLIISNMLWLIHPWYTPSDYSKDFLLYIAVSTTTIAMVLVQENPNSQEHVIYYDSKNLMDSKTRYSRVEKLALATVIAVYKFRHYIFLCTTTVLADQNPMYYILTRQVLGGKYSRWMFIL